MSCGMFGGQIRPHGRSLGSKSGGGVLGGEVVKWMAQVQFGRSVVSLCDPMDFSTLGLPVHHQFMELAQTHLH